jgi:hypothetical protein
VKCEVFKVVAMQNKFFWGQRLNWQKFADATDYIAVSIIRVEALNLSDTFDRSVILIT